MKMCRQIEMMGTQTGAEIAKSRPSVVTVKQTIGNRMTIIKVPKKPLTP